MIFRALAFLTLAAAAADEKPSPALGPYVRFTGPDTAVVRWETATAQIGAVEFGETTAFGVIAAEATPVMQHEVMLRGLKRDSLYYYRLKFAEVAGETFTLETAFNFSKDPLPDIKPFGEDSDVTLAVQRILQTIKIQRGYALVERECETLAYEMARLSDWTVVLVAKDGEDSDRLRAGLDAKGVYGHRFQVMSARDGALPFANGTFNLIVGNRAPDEWQKYLAPGGMSWSRVFEGTSGIMPNRWKPQVSGAGAWSHAYGDAAQTTNSGDTAVRGRGLALRWFGEPGVRGMMDRQPRNPPPLCVNGTFFIQGNDRLFALDSLNGAFLWSMEVPGLRRVNIPRDCANMCADDGALYVAIRDRAWQIHARSGKLMRSIRCDEAGRNWGYVAVVGDMLFGSTSKPGATYTHFEGGADFSYDFHHSFALAKVLSDSVFACRKMDGKRVWAYKARGFALNSTISIGGGRVYFVESRGLAPWGGAKPGETLGRVESPALYKDTWLVALDAATGAMVWERPVPLAAFGTATVLYLCYADEKLILLNSAVRAYHTSAYSATDGLELWRRAQPWARDHHGGHLYHPVIAQGMAIVEPFGYDLGTGDIRLRDLPERGGCTTLSAAAECLHFINWDYDKGSLYVRDFADGQTRQFTGSRGNCWISFISGSGMMLLPAASGGCTCKYPNQVSLGFASEE